MLSYFLEISLLPLQPQRYISIVFQIVLCLFRNEMLRVSLPTRLFPWWFKLSLFFSFYFYCDGPRISSCLWFIALYESMTLSISSVFKIFSIIIFQNIHFNPLYLLSYFGNQITCILVPFSVLYTSLSLSFSLPSGSFSLSHQILVYCFSSSMYVL